VIESLTRNWGWKLLSLAAAVLAWSSFAGDQQLTFLYDAPVTYKGLRRDLEISSAGVASVTLQLRGGSKALEKVTGSRSSVLLDFSHVGEAGERTFDIDAGNVKLPPGAALLRSIPSQLRFRFERMVVRDVPVKIRVAGEPPAGYRVARQTVSPGSLRIAGPESRVLMVDEALTDSVDLSSIEDVKEFRVNTFAGDPHVRFESSSRVVVRIEMEKR
jgi:hypothetical protein